jgi:cilia- and flagella-associated protein 57
MGDRKILTASMDGSVLLWNVLKGLREADHMQPRSAYTCAATGLDLTSAYAASTDAEIPLDCAVGAMAMTHNQRMLLVGTADAERPGRVRSRLVGPAGSAYTDPFVDLYVHAGPVTRLRLSFDGTLLFSGGADGALCILEVAAAEEPKALGQGKAKEHRETEGQFAEEILVVGGPCTRACVPASLVTRRREADDLA